MPVVIVAMWQYFTSIALRPFNLLSHYLPVPIFDPFFRFLPYASLGVICFACDSLFTSVREHEFLRAVVDNASHGIIAFVSWWVVSKFHSRKDILEAVFCAMIACGIDVDHFIAAKSIKLEAALRLNSRPFLHTTTIVFIIVPILQVWLAQNNPFLRSLPYLFAVAVISHHLRDGNRRGLWFWPLGNTHPLPYWMYISFTMALPILIKEVKHFIERLPAISVSKEGVPLLDV